MELSDEKVLESLLSVWAQDQRVKRLGRSGLPKPIPELPATGPRIKSVRRSCKCTVCPRCLENARWERIFKEKFEDPDYYLRRSVTLESPLSELS